jgi:protoporphyrin/coproporphyrin ferrochelatase
MAERLAVVLLNLGGPDSLPAVEPFLFNLFNDGAIIGLPQPLRRLVARLIARRRAAIAAAIYARLGGASPLLANTREQAGALQERLTLRGDHAAVFVCMRYWHPFSEAVAREVRSFAPDRIVLLPLYPQYSTTTTASSLADWRRAASGIGLAVPTHAICCYPSSRGLVEAVARLIREALEETDRSVPLRLLFSAHGLPKRVVARGDPYQSQVELTVAEVVEALGDMARDHVVCYQSRVGPLEWIGPSTEDELTRAAVDRVGVVVVPVAFVSEHSETLFELDIDYRAKAAQLGVPAYVRVPTVGTAREFIGGLAELVEAAIANPETVSPQSGARLCAPAFVGCGCGCGARLGGN